MGDPFKGTSSVALNPVIKFTTLFGLLPMQLRVELARCTSAVLTVVFYLIAAWFVRRSFYGMRLRREEGTPARAAVAEAV